MQHNSLIMSPEECQRKLNVSHETKEKLELYLYTLKKWQEKLNLVGKSTLLDPWKRHVYDCGQVAGIASKYNQKIIDVGSGAGLPGIIWSIMGVKDIKLVESDQKKTIFLNEVSRLCDINVEILNSRIEDIFPIRSNVFTARAFAPIYRIFDYLVKNINHETRFILFKGKNAEEEIKFAETYWNNSYRKKMKLLPTFNLLKSLSNLNSKIVICNFIKA